MPILLDIASLSDDSVIVSSSCCEIRTLNAVGTGSPRSLARRLETASAANAPGASSELPRTFATTRISLPSSRSHRKRQGLVRPDDITRTNATALTTSIMLCLLTKCRTERLKGDQGNAEAHSLNAIATVSLHTSSLLVAWLCTLLPLIAQFVMAHYLIARCATSSRCSSREKPSARPPSG